jgi:hypothetical protein
MGKDDAHPQHEGHICTVGVNVTLDQIGELIIRSVVMP